MYNHSYDPNVDVIDIGNRKLVVISRKNIKKGEEIYINYGKTYWNKRCIKPE